MKNKHWSKTQLLHEVVKNPNIHLKGRHSYYSDCWDGGFEQSVVRYLQGDEQSRDWQLAWDIDQLYIGDYVCIGAEAVILMGGNHTHRLDWFCLYPFLEYIEEAWRYHYWRWRLDWNAGIYYAGRSNRGRCGDCGKQCRG